MPFFSRKSKNKDNSTVAARGKGPIEHTNGHTIVPVKPRYISTWNSKEVVPEEVEELIHLCTLEMKSRAEALDAPFLLLPFRPNFDASPARTFIGNFFNANHAGSFQYRSTSLQRELRLTEPTVLCSILKWCWSRIPGGVVTWTVYDMFRLGERGQFMRNILWVSPNINDDLDSKMARTAFNTFIPMSVESTSRKNIVYDFFDLLAAIAAHSKTNGLGGRKLSRMAAWWAFDHSDDGKGFEGGYKSWSRAADASSHLFFAYLRSLAPEAVEGGISGISALPRSLQALVAQTEYPPGKPSVMQTRTPKVVMIVDSVSPTPFALLRRSKHFEYREEDRLLQRFSEYSDPVQALTAECQRVLYGIASTNQSAARSRQQDHGLQSSPESWSRFTDLGFSNITSSTNDFSSSFGSRSPTLRPGDDGLRSGPRSRHNDMGRPTTPSWADFLSSGFVDETAGKGPSTTTLLLPPDKILPPISSGGSRRSPSQFGDEEGLEPGELASITRFDLDDTFWWVWMTSLASEEPVDRKAVFGRCALVETEIMGGLWLVMEEQVKGASPGPEEGAYIAEKKTSRFTFGRKAKANRRKSATVQKPPEFVENASRAFSPTPSKSSMSPDQHAKIKAAAALLAIKQQDHDDDQLSQRRGRFDDAHSTRTNSVLTLGLTSEAGPAMKWASAFDKEAIRRQYLGDNFAGKGLDVTSGASSINTEAKERKQPAPATSFVPPPPPPVPSAATDPPRFEKQHELPPVPKEDEAVDLSQRTQAPPPAPLPKEPAITVQHVVDDGASFAASEAADVPLPTTTLQEEKAIEAGEPMNPPVSPKVTQVERKPVPRTSNINNHPAFRSRNEQSQNNASKATPIPKPTPATEAARRAWEARAASSSSPDSPPSKKQPSGLKKFFGKKKETQNRKSLTKPPPPGSLHPPSETNVGRRLSLLRKKTPTQAVPTRATVPAEATDVPQQSSEPIKTTSDARGGTYLDYSGLRGQDHDGSENASMSRVDTNEQQDAARAFSRFDQGPMTDAPAFAPRDSVDTWEQDEDTPSVPRYRDEGNDYPQGHPGVPQRSEFASPNQFATPMEYPSHGEDTASETSTQHSEAQYAQATSVPAPDRWAQIRKNAAERAARLSEEQSRRSASQSVSQSMRSDRTDEGETSGEETIESRVARIKARVAELTGNIDQNNAPTPAHGTPR